MADLTFLTARCSGRFLRFGGVPDDIDADLLLDQRILPYFTGAVACRYI